MRERFACEGNIVHEAAVSEVSGQLLKEELFQDAAGFLKAMGDGTRFKILWALDKHELCVCDLANLLGMSKSAVSHQLARLR
ncbi:MAG: metalloregulator ArsR/SmtB family transcription factor, partial [Eubacteriales bacterium]|nr:metalloregulator ArsR/SmtB family transcription factor [Eubacteriales bacterium]